MARLDRGRLIVGLVLIALGVLLGLERSELLGDFNVWSLWPLVIVAFGVSMLLSDRSSPVGGLIVIGIGIVLLAQSLDLFGFDVWGVFGALLLIGVGLWVFLRRDRPIPEVIRSTDYAGVEASGEDWVSLTTVFGDRDIDSAATAFRGGTMTVVFGDLELDLSRAQLAPGGAAIDVTSLFGDADIVVPAGWEVRVQRTEILGDVKDRTAAPAAASGLPVLTVRATAILGDVEVKQHG